jgi:hypothetical protein
MAVVLGVLLARGVGGVVKSMGDVSALTHKQARLVELLADPLDDRPDCEKCKEVGIVYQTLWSWKQKPAFLAALDKRVTEQRAVLRVEAYKALGAIMTMRMSEPAALIAAARAVLSATGDIGSGNVNVTTNVKVENEIKTKSDDELWAEIDEDEAMLERAEVLAK